MRTFLIVLTAVILSAFCAGDTEASVMRAPGDLAVVGHWGSAHSVFLDPSHCFAAYLCASLASGDAEPQRKRREDKDEDKDEEDKKERKEEEKERKENEADEDDGGGFGGACIGSIFESLFSSDDDDDDDDDDNYKEWVPAPTPALPTPISRHTTVVLPGPNGEVSRRLWSDLGGEGSGAEPMWMVTEGTALRVHREEFYGDEMWLEVSVTETPHMTGWIRRGYVQEYEPVERTYPLAEVPVIAEDQPDYSPIGARRRVEMPRWQLLSSFSWGVFFNNDLYDEYKGRVWSLAGGARIFPNELLHLVLRGSYLKAYGDPAHVWYETTDALEYPRDSRLSIIRLSFMAGTYHMVGDTPTQMAWAAGPCLCRVAEEAEILVVKKDFTGIRVDELEQYRVGVDMSLDFQWRVGKAVPIFVDIGAYVIPVERNEEKSLTVDFLDNKVIGGVTVGFGIGYSVL